MEAGAIRQLDPIDTRQIEGPITAIADRNRPGGEHSLCCGQALRLRPGVLARGFLAGSDQPIQLFGDD